MIGPKIEQKLRGWTPRWNRRRWIATLVAMPIVALAVPIGILAVPYLEMLNDMAIQPKAKAQGLYGHFQGEALVVERPPVAGTMPVTGHSPYPFPGKDAESAKLAEEALKNPLGRTPEVLARGRKVWNTFCIVCHGEHAEGNGRIVGPALFPAPPSLHSEAARAFKDGRIFHVITRGQNKMPSYAGDLTPEERWSVVHYVRALQVAREMAVKEAGQ